MRDNQQEIQKLIERYKDKDEQQCYIHAECVSLIRALVGTPADHATRQRYIHNGRMLLSYSMYLNDMEKRMTTLLPEYADTIARMVETLFTRIDYCAPEVLAQYVSELFEECL